MPERAVRFGVKSSAGQVSVTWKCFTRTGSGKADVYVTCRSLALPLKLSLHESGQWHVAFDREEFPNLFEPSSSPSSRFSRIWEQAQPLSHGLTLACRIHFPWYAINRGSGVGDPKVVWLPAPTEGHSTEVAIFVSTRQLDLAAWPGRDSMGTLPVGYLRLDGNASALLVHHTVPAVAGGFPQLPPPRFFKGASEQDLSKANRALAWGRHTDGSVIFQEAPVIVGRSGQI